VVVVEEHFIRTPAGVFSSYSLPFPYWEHYLEFFDEVRPLARVGWSDQTNPRWVRADGPGVRFVPLPDYQGFRQIVRRLPMNLRLARRGLAGSDYFLLMGGNVSALAWFWLKLKRVPYARAVIGHEGDSVVLVPDLQRFGLARLMAGLSHWFGRVQVRGACCCNYWAQRLYESYPPRPGVPRFIIPEIELGAEVMTGPRQPQSFCGDPLRLVSVGRMNPEKGYDILLEALKRLDESGARRWTLEAIGPGPHLELLRARAVELGLADRVTFPGQVPWGPELFSRLDRADLYVLPSLTEGMPRAVLEAMARGVPAVATRVGGLPDILDSSVIVPPGDPVALAGLIRPYIGDRQRLARESRTCVERAQDFHPDRVRARRHAFWGYLRDFTDRWRERTHSRSVPVSLVLANCA
jgi:glycosyltransferase involved in cell wall biosynthesis